MTSKTIASMTRADLERATEVERELAEVFRRIDAATATERRAHQLADRIVLERAAVEGAEAALVAAAEVRTAAVEARGLRVALEAHALELRDRRAREAHLVASRARALKASGAAARQRVGRVTDAALREAIERRRDSYPSRRQLQEALWGSGFQFSSDRFKRACDDLRVMPGPAEVRKTKVPRT